MQTSTSAMSLTEKRPLKTGNPSLVPSNISVLLTNLRLLDLDKKCNWSDIFPSILTDKGVQKGQTKGIQAVDWTLYRLFELWNPDETRDKLEPFFLTFEPSQSSKLRVALYRCLVGLKKAGVLGRDIALGLTVFDDCKREELVRTLMLFSGAVLRKVRASRPSSLPVRVTPHLGGERRLSVERRGSMLPLATAHKASLARLLKRKSLQRDRAKKFKQVVDDVVKELKGSDGLAPLRLGWQSDDMKMSSQDAALVKEKGVRYRMDEVKWTTITPGNGEASANQPVPDDQSEHICKGVNEARHHSVRTLRSIAQQDLERTMQTHVVLPQPRANSLAGLEASSFRPEGLDKAVVAQSRTSFSADSYVNIGGSIGHLDDSKVAGEDQVDRDGSEDTAALLRQRRAESQEFGPTLPTRYCEGCKSISPGARSPAGLRELKLCSSAVKHEPDAERLSRAQLPLPIRTTSLESPRQNISIPISPAVTKDGTPAAYPSPQSLTRAHLVGSTLDTAKQTTAAIATPTPSPTNSRRTSVAERTRMSMSLSDFLLQQQGKAFLAMSPTSSNHTLIGSPKSDAAGLGATRPNIASAASGASNFTNLAERKQQSRDSHH